MGILAWIILGLIAGFIASRIVHNEGAGCAARYRPRHCRRIYRRNHLQRARRRTGVTGFNLWSLFVATIGAVVILVVYHALFDRR